MSAERSVGSLTAADLGRLVAMDGWTGLLADVEHDIERGSCVEITIGGHIGEAIGSYASDWLDHSHPIAVYEED